MKLKILMSFIIIYLVWGSTFTAIKVGLESFPPIALAASRFMLAGVIFLLLSKFKDFRSMSFQDFKNEAMVGILLNLGNAGVCWSEKYISSGVAALIVGAIPIVFMLFNWLSFERKVPHFSALFAVIFGIFGISLISTGENAQSDWSVVGVLLLANFLWVAGSLKFRMVKSHLSYYTRAAVQLLSGATTLIVFSTLVGEKVDFSSINLNGYMSVVYLSLAGTVVAYSAYSYLLKNVKTELTSTYALINPLVALMLGVIFLGEPFTTTITISAAFILFSVMLTLYGDKIFRKKAVVVVERNSEVELKKVC